LEYIPWEELVRISALELSGAGIDTSLPFPSRGGAQPEWVLWKPASRWYFDCHHFVLLEEIHEYCVAKQWYLPGHFLEEDVIFAATQVTSSNFIPGLWKFWSDWVS